MTEDMPPAASDFSAAPMADTLRCPPPARIADEPPADATAALSALSLPAVAVLSADAGLCARLVAAGSGLSFSWHASARDLLQFLRQQPRCAVLLDGERSAVAYWPVLAWLRDFHPAPCLVLTPHDVVEERIHSLLIGADACLEASVPVDTVVAVLMTLLRRQVLLDSARQAAGVGSPGAVAPTVALPAEPTAPDGPQLTLQLEAQGWQLTDGQGTTLLLSPRERTLLQLLVAQPGRVFSRVALAQHIVSDSEGQLSHCTPHSINMLISRLRRKAQMAGLHLPLRSIPQHGYLLESHGMPPVRAGLPASD